MAGSLVVGKRPMAAPLAYCSGIVCGYLALAAAAETMRTISAFTTAIYAVLACALLFGGTLKIVRSDEHRVCKSHDIAVSTVGASLCAGFASSAVLSPCCGPLALAMSAGAGGTSSPLLPVAAFSLGHVLPVAAGAKAGAWLKNITATPALSGAYATVFGGLMVALGLYYAVLA